MKKFLLLASLLILSVSSIFAQTARTGAITGRLIDGKDNEPIIGAVIELKKAGNDKASHFTTEADGNINIQRLPYGDYTLKFTFLGYGDLTKTVKVDKASVSVGTLTMKEEATAIKDVLFEGRAIRTSVKGDTVAYNAEAFKVSADADTENLIKKMPGITVTSDGTVEAQGEEVKKVLVDGREFFGQDVTTALKSLPADMVSRIEVFDKLSDQAEFTGIDDGQGYKAINIITALDKRSGQFGKIAASYGAPDYYYANAVVNVFSGDSRISFLGLANNLNQQNFSFEDIVGATSTGGGGGGWGAGRNFMVRPEAGTATVQAFGLNYMDKWGKKNKVEVTGSYFFNHTNTRNHNDKQEWFDDVDEKIIKYTDSYSDTKANNWNHRLNARLDYKIGEGRSLMVRPSFSWQSYDNWSRGLSTLEFTPYEGITEETSKTFNVTDRDSRGYNAGLNALYRTRLNKPGRTITVNVDGNTGKNNGPQISQEFTFYPDPNDGYGDINDLLSANRKNIRKRVSDSRSYNLNGGVTYSEPLSQKSSLNIEYRAEYRYSDSDVRVYWWLEESGLDNLLFSDEYDQIQSNIANSGYLTHRVNPGYRYNGEKINFNVNVSYQNARMMNTQDMPVVANPEQSYTFDNILYSAHMRYNINSANSLNIRVNSSTRNPSISNLQNVNNMNNLQNIRAGNPDLDPSYNHRFNARYNYSNVQKGMTLGVFLGGNIQDKYIANHVITTEGYEVPNSGGHALDKGDSFTRPENMNGYWSANAGIDFGIPIPFIKCNFNFGVNGNYSEIPSKINNVVTNTASRGIGGRAALGSNISENIDFMLAYDCKYEVSDYTAAEAARTEGNKNELLRQSASASLKWVFWKGITFSANASYNNIYRSTQDTRETYLVCNALIGKKIFKSQRGELSLTANDIFDQNKAYRTSVSNNTITNNRDIQIGRYFGVQFIYNLRMYGKGASRNSSDYDGLDQSTGGNRRQGFGGPGGRPPGGMPFIP